MAKERLRFQVASIWGIVAIIALVFTMRRSFSVQNKNKELESLSYVDPLTGLNNRRFYYQQLKDKQRLASSQEYRIALLDLDYFKQVNDKYGHDVGDEVLIETAKRVSSLIDTDELLIRWGGEEFLALLKNVSSIEQRLSDILTAVNGATYTTVAGELAITTSIGLSDSGNILELEASDGYFRNADKKLYEAKRTGRNRYVS
ncbi:GGDEF domain-containing protein [Vibrio profundi]|uniref:GGDEF domain-containing protein n=1 Tax=Vibrio profundi TaxID=1774960 RepID=UPI0037354B0F